MNPQTFNRLIPLLESHLHENQRHALITRAFRTAPFYSNIDWDDSARAFTVRLLQQLDNYGDLQIDDNTVRPAVAHLLITLFPDVGSNVQTEINELLVEMEQPPLPIPTSPISTPPIERVTDDWQRWKAGIVVGALLVTLLVVGLVTFSRQRPLCQPGQNCVLLAKFTPEENGVAQKTTTDALARLRDIVEVGERGFEVHEVDPINSEAEAQAEARKNNALLVVWGYVLESEGDEQVFNFTLSNRLGLDGANNVRPMRLLPLDYELGDEVACQTACLTVQGQGEFDERLTAIAHAARGLFHYALEDFATAQQEFSQALALEDVEPPTADNDLPLCDLAALAEYDFLEESPSNKWQPDLLRYYLGRTLAFQGDYGAALQQLHIAAAHNPDDPAVWVSIALACEGWLGPGSDVDVTPIWEAALDRVDDQIDSAPHLFNRAIIHELQEEWPAAGNNYRQALTILTDSDVAATTYAAWVGWGRVEAKSGQREVAKERFESALQVDEEALWAYLEMARLYSEDAEEADHWLAQAEQVTASQYYPGNRNLELARADLCRTRQDSSCAAVAYGRALDHSPPSGWLHTRVSDFYRHEPRWEVALVHYEAAARLREHDPQAHANLGYTRTANNDLAGAVEAYRRAIELSYPADDVTIEAYCEALARIVEVGELGEGLGEMERCGIER